MAILFWKCCFQRSRELKTNKWNLKVLISDLLFVALQFHNLFPKLWIWEHAVFTLLRRLRCLLNLSSVRRKVSSDFFQKNFFKKILSKNFGLLGIKSVHGRPDSPSWYTDSWPYIVLLRAELHHQLHSLLVHWSYRERNTHPCNAT